MTDLNQLFDAFEQALQNLEQGLKTKLQQQGKISQDAELTVIALGEDTTEIKSGRFGNTVAIYTSRDYEIQLFSPLAGVTRQRFPRPVLMHYAEPPESPKSPERTLDHDHDSAAGPPPS